jgi:superfamily II DNA or RNA helicase
MIDVRTASELLDFSARIGEGHQAKEQLEGAVAIHNILAGRGVAYLADEVGMGKTYVALGALALFRHYQPDFSALIIAPRKNIQNKWMKELQNFVAYNVRFPDLRVKALDRRPARPLVACESLLDLAHEVSLDPNRDFFLRLSSFSLSATGKEMVDPEAARRFRDGLRRHLPWMRDEVFDLRHKQAFKDNMAKALCCALPRFDLVIVDEGHNLKHGFGENVPARNRVLALAMGRSGVDLDPKLFPGYGPRAKRVLFLSATPVEESYRHLWNQLDVFGLGGPYEGLKKPDVEEEEKKAIAARFLIRRVTQVRVGGEEYTKNLYRREWRRGGVRTHDEPIRIEDTKQRLVVALVQKKVSELLGHERFNSSFQIGMLASFESFLETTRLKREDGEIGNFDDPDQTDRSLEREGIDVADLNRLSRSYRSTFGTEMPHPKMDALVDSLSGAWTCGEKALIFVRRVASVKELKRKLDERYDRWLMRRLTDELPEGLHAKLQSIFEQYRVEKSETPEPKYHTDEDSDPGGKDTFFAWFFRGEGPRGIVSGANIQQRFIQRGTAYSTFFSDNYVADLLSCRPGDVEGRLGQELGVGPDELKALLRERSKRFLSRAKKHGRADRFEAAQAAAVELLKDREGPHQEGARVVWQQRFESSLKFPHADEAPEVGDYLELTTFFTELRVREALRSRLWPSPEVPDSVQAFRERELRAQLLASAARLGHAFIDLYVMTIRRLGSLRLRAQESAEDDGADLYSARIVEYLDILEEQMRTPREGHSCWGAFDELAAISENFDLLLDVNEPDARLKPLIETAGIFGKQLLRGQQPVGGMSGQVNQTLVKQFRMPGYPLVLITTDLLQEGEDLHTFCSAVHHYGIAWTPSSMEQRVGRIDRVRSHTERRLTGIEGRPPLAGELLQVYFPHLEDTVEVLQVQRVLERINVFLRLMHEGLTVAGGDERTIDAGKEFVRGRRTVPQIRERLRSAFPVTPEQLRRDRKGLAVGRIVTGQLNERFTRLAETALPNLDVVWEPPVEPGMLLGTVRLGGRVQPFSLLLRSVGAWPAIRCISPVGCVRPGADQDTVVASAALLPVKIGAVLTREDRTYDLTAEGDVLLAPGAETDAARVAALIRRITQQADELEQVHLPGRDEVLATFKEELSREGSHGR